MEREPGRKNCDVTDIFPRAIGRNRGGARHRRKGDRIERETVERHRALGIHAARFPSSSASRFRGSGHDFDVYAFGTNLAPLEAECKARKDGAGFVTLETWLGDYDALFLRRNHADPIVVVPWRIWARLLLPRGAGSAS